jgi:hypothetical protein
MQRADAIRYVGHCVDDALAVRDVKDMPANAILVGWQCGFEPMFVAVWSYLGGALDEDDAVVIATDLLEELRWFSGKPTEPDYVLQGAG